MIASKFSVEQVFEMTKRFTMNLLAISSQLWKEASKYATIYERRLSPILGAFISAGDASTRLSLEQDAELEKLMFPGEFRAANRSSGFVVPPD
jgi:hypothetical protein